MADNRLYIGNKETKEFRCISKSANTWNKLRPKDVILVNEIIKTDNVWSEKTDLVLFTEADDKMFEYFHNKKQ